MKTVIYLDELLLVNYALAAALLLAAGLLCGRACSGLRLCGGAAMAAVSTLVLLLPEFPLPGALLYKAASCTAVVALTYGLPGRRIFVQLCLWYVLLNVLLCGAALLPGVHTNNFAVYISLPPGRLLACCAVVYGVLRGLLYCFGRAGVRSVPARLELNGSALPVQAFYDTGFSVQDPLSGRAVVLVQYRPARPLLSAPVQQFLDAYFAAEDAALPPPGAGVRLVPCRTVTGQALLPAVPAALRTATACVPGLLAAFCREPLSPGGGTLLFGPDTARQLGLCEDGLSTYL